MRPGTTLLGETIQRIDSLAKKIAEPAPDWKTLRKTYDHDVELKVPAVVLSFPKGIPIEVTVEE
jgi:hypothetical protein